MPFISGCGTKESSIFYVGIYQNWLHAIVKTTGVSTHNKSEFMVGQCLIPAYLHGRLSSTKTLFILKWELQAEFKNL